MRRLALPFAICLASCGCAAAEEPEPAGGNGNQAGGGALNVSGSPGSSGATSTGGVPGDTGGAAPTGGVPSGSAGTLSTAGADGVAGSGSGGAAPGAGTCAMTAAATGAPALIDDLDDGDPNITVADGRTGGWYLSTDNTGTTTPAAGAPVPIDGGMPGKAIHVTGSGLTGWGASLSAAIANPMTGCYNAAPFTGITVMLKGTGSIWVSVLTAAVRDAPPDMRNHYKKQVQLTPDWTTVTIDFSELAQPGGWGTIVPFDVTKIYGIDFGPMTATAPATTSFDFWIDNLSFK